jgi:hypothetical protein
MIDGRATHQTVGLFLGPALAILMALASAFSLFHLSRCSWRQNFSRERLR